MNSLNRHLVLRFIGRPKRRMALTESIKRLFQYGLIHVERQRQNDGDVGGGAIRSQLAEELQSSLILGQWGDILRCEILAAGSSEFTAFPEYSRFDGRSQIAECGTSQEMLQRKRNLE